MATITVPGEPLEDLVHKPLHSILDGWEQLEAPSTPEPALLQRVPQIFAALHSLMQHSAIDALRAAVERGDPRGLSALGLLDDTIDFALETLQERFEAWNALEKWAALSTEAEVGAVLSRASSTPQYFAACMMLVGRARRRLLDLHGTISAYRAVIGSNTDNRSTLSAAHDNLGEALKETGEIDAALKEYALALGYERNPRGRARIIHNRALALQEIGELDLAAFELQREIVSLEQEIGATRELAVTLDSVAGTISLLGQPQVAMQLMERAQTLFAPDDFAGLVFNALNRSRCHLRLQQEEAAAAAFREAHDFAFQQARKNLDKEHYRRGFAAAREAALPARDDAFRMLDRGIEAKNAGNLDVALNAWGIANGRARKSGDFALALRIDANAAGLMFERGQLGKCREWSWNVAREAASRGLARPEMMALGQLATLAEAGVDGIPPSIILYAKAAELLRLHGEIVAESHLDAPQAKFEIYDPGTLANSLALLAEKHSAFAMAVEYYREAVARSRSWNDEIRTANRLAGLRKALGRIGAQAEADEIAGELQAIADAATLPSQELIMVHRALGDRSREKLDRSTAISEYRKACSLLETWRAKQPLGRARTQALNRYPPIHRALAKQLREAGDDAGAFEALQGRKGRGLIDLLAAANGDPAADAPPTVAEIQLLLERLGGEAPTVLVDFSVEEDLGLSAYLVGRNLVRAVHVQGDTSAFATVEQGDVREREARLIRLCIVAGLLSETAEAVSGVVPPGCRLLLVSDERLQNLPLHAIQVRGRAWCELFPISYLGAAGELRFARGAQSPLATALVAGDSAGDLPHAAEECRQVAELLGTEAKLGPKCSRAIIAAELGGASRDIVHLAVHGRGDAKRGARASVKLATDDGGAEWVAFDALKNINWTAGLVVFSGCSTAVAGRRDGSMLSVADAASETGASAVIACLWPVGDAAANFFMKAFYERLVELRQTRWVDLRIAFDHAQRALRGAVAAGTSGDARRRDGRDAVSNAVPDTDLAIVQTAVWASIILIGDPLVRARMPP